MGVAPGVAYVTYTRMCTRCIHHNMGITHICIYIATVKHVLRKGVFLQASCMRDTSKKNIQKTDVVYTYTIRI